MQKLVRPAIIPTVGKMLFSITALLGKVIVLAVIPTERLKGITVVSVHRVMKPMVGAVRFSIIQLSVPQIARIVTLGMCPHRKTTMAANARLAIRAAIFML